MAKGKVRTLWGREFQVVKKGLDEADVTEFVEQLQVRLADAQRRAAEAQQNADQPSYRTSLDTLAEQTVVEAEKMAAKAREDAEQVRIQAEAQAARIVAEATMTAEDQTDSIGRMAKAAAEEAQRELEAARAQRALTEEEGRRQAQRLIEHAKERIEAQVRRDVQGAAERLLPYVEDVVKEVRALSVDLKNWETSPPAAPRSPEPAESQPVPPEEHAPSAAVAPQAPADVPSQATVGQGTTEVVLEAPVSPSALGEVYELLARSSGISIREARKAADGSYVIEVAPESAKLLTMLRDMPIVAELVVESPAGNGTPGEAEASEGQTPSPT